MAGVLFTVGDVNLYEQDLHSFEPGQWLTDNAISFALEYIHLSHKSSSSKQQYAILYPCFTEALKHCSAEEIPIFLGDPDDLKNKTLFVILSDNADPSVILGGSHWTLLLWHNDTKSFHYFDSMNNSYNDFVPKLARRIYEHVYAEKFQYGINIVKGRQQENASDCGMHVIELCVTLMNSTLDEVATLKLDTNTLSQKRREWIDIGNKLKRVKQLESGSD